MVSLRACRRATRRAMLSLAVAMVAITAMPAWAAGTTGQVVSGVVAPQIGVRVNPDGSVTTGGTMQVTITRTTLDGVTVVTVVPR
jgi:hypothetical protein